MASEPGSAADAIRASVAALSRRMRTAPWSHDDAGNLFAPPQALPPRRNKAWIAEMDGQELASHIALLASPDVALALAELLDARRAETFALTDWQAQKTLANSDALEDAQHALTRAFAAVEAAILRSGQ